MDALLELCIFTAGLWMADIRRLHSSRFSTINPVSDMIDRMAGVQWHATENFWVGGVSESATVDVEPAHALFQIVVYDELFASSMRAALEPTSSLPRFDFDMRPDYISYCIPSST